MTSHKMNAACAASWLVLVCTACGNSATPNAMNGGGSGGSAGSAAGETAGGSAGLGAATAGAPGIGGAGASSAGGAGQSAGGNAGANAGGAASGGAAGSSPCEFAGGDVTAAAFPAGLTLTKACSPYSIDSLPGINVSNGGTLTIEAGVTIKFAVNSVLLVGVTGTGKLLATGTAQDPITLTSNPTQAMQAAGDWYGVDFGLGTSGSKLSYVKVDYAGGNFDAAIVGDVGVSPAAVAIDHASIDHVGDGANGVLENDPKSNFAITSSSFAGIPAGNYAISVAAPSFAGIAAGNTFASGEQLDIAGGTVDTTASWSNPGVPIAVTDNVSVDGASATLSIAAGTTLKFASGVGLAVGKAAGGKLVLAGSAAAHVALTSSAATPAAGAWLGTQIFAAGKAQISYADFRYGGAKTVTTPGDVSLQSVATAAQLVVDHSTFKDSAGWGIYVACAKSAPTGAVSVDANTTYANDAAGNQGPGPTGAGCP